MQIACAKRAMRRCNNTIAEFDTLPDAALVNLKAIIALSCRSKSSIYRDIAAGRISKPVYIGSQSVRWRVGDVREYLAGEKTVK